MPQASWRRRGRAGVGADGASAIQFLRVRFVRYKPSDFAKARVRPRRTGCGGAGQEALEQHFTISHVVRAKSVAVTRSGYLTLLAILLAGAAFTFWKAGSL